MTTMTISRPLAGFTNDSIHALPLHVLDRDGFAAWSAQQPAAVQAWLKSQQYLAAPGSVAPPSRSMPAGDAGRASRRVRRPGCSVDMRTVCMFNG